MKKLLPLLGILALGNGLQADSGFQASLTPDIALVDSSEIISGVALNIWGENEVHGVDLGFVNGLSGESYGFSWSFLGTYAENYKGVLWGGLFVKTSGDMVGWQAGALNINQGTLKGLQSGWVNIAKDVTGVQLGLVNYTQNLNGIQIGFANIVTNNEWFSELPGELAVAFPIVNWSF